jgi:VWFA-related protein
MQMELKLDTTRHFVLRAYNSKNRYVTDTLEVAVKNIEYLKATSTIFEKDLIYIRWKYKFCDSVRVEGFDKTFPATGEVTVSPETSQWYTLKVFRRWGRVDEDSVFAKVRPPVIEFSVPRLVYKQTKNVMKWEVREGFQVELTGTGRTITDLSGMETIPTDTRKKYRLVVKNKAGDIVYDESKNIESVLSPIRNFRVPESTRRGNPANIYWQVAPGFQVSLTGLKGPLPNTGNVSVFPKAKTRYTLTASLAGRPIDSLSRVVEVFQSRAFIQNTRNITELPRDTQIQFEIFAIDYSRYPNEVRLKVLAVDDKGNFVAGLEDESKRRQRNIIKRILEKTDDRTQQIRSFTFKEVLEERATQHDISLALDYSGSMMNSIFFLESAVQSFIKSKEDNDRIAITKYDDHIVEASPLESDQTLLRERMSAFGLDSLGGSTALYASADAAMGAIKDSKNQKELILFTDGMENASLQYMDEYAITATELAKKARKNDVAVHVVAFGSGVSSSILKQLAHKTGGNFYTIENQMDIQSLFEEIPIILHHYYEITYRPVVRGGNHDVSLVYDNLQGNEMTIISDYYIGEDFIIDETDPDAPPSYWEEVADSLNKTPLSVPQAVAYFDFDKDILEEQYKPGLDQYLDYLNKFSRAVLVIFGHTDSRGPVDYSYDLSERRAAAVRNYLIEKGISKERMILVPCGKNEMIWYPEDTNWKARENRRIEILMLR